MNEIQNCDLSLCKTVHHGIKCFDCFREPIIGYRYKCSICYNYNLCEKCEEKNGMTRRHPHYFIKIRDEEKNKVIKEEVNKPKLIIKDITMENFNKMKEFRNNFNLSEDYYPDDRLLEFL